MRLHQDLPREVAEPRVIVYHVCATGATGSVLGPHDALAYWWAEPSGVRLVTTEPMDVERRIVLTQAVMEALGTAGAAELLRRAQDERAEAPDL